MREERRKKFATQIGINLLVFSNIYFFCECWIILRLWAINHVRSLEVKSLFGLTENNIKHCKINTLE